jgi:3-oxoacyl-[acyl-carrier-protein] synthase II
MTGRCVAVTGLGLVSSIGLDEDAFWTNLLAGRPGIRALEGFDLDGMDVVNGAQVDTAELDERQDRRTRRVGRTVRLALEAARQALDAAGRLTNEAQDVASVWGSAYGPCEALYTTQLRYIERGVKGMRPSTVPMCMVNSISSGVSIEFQLLGTNQTIVSACTSATNAIGYAFRMIRDGYADAALCGGVDACFDPYHYGAWNNLGVLSKIPEPERALRPFAADRDGTLIGEGAGALMLESLELAEARGARIRGEIIGYGESSDATHLTSPSVEGQSKAICRALQSAGVAPEAIGFINAHGTATQSNDVTESRSILEALGPAGAQIPVCANKSYFGHTLGASGALESAAALLSLEAGVLPPNLNLERPDPEVDLRLVGEKPLAIDAELAMKTSFGFGGGNGVLIFRRSANGAVG